MNTRNLGRSPGTHGPSVVLPAKGRRAKLRGAPLVAVIGMGFGEHSMFGGTYRKPEVLFRTLDKNGETSFCGPQIELLFQSHVVGSVGNGHLDRKGPRGFLSTAKGPWTPSYGGTIKARCHYSGDSKELSQIIRLIDKAREVTRATRRGCDFKECDLLRLIIGLQRCGVEIWIHNETVDAKRAQRAAWERELDHEAFLKLENRTLHFG